MKYLESDAIISECKRYRYLLRRVWDWSKPRALFVMLNPSTADANEDDATIRSLVRICKALGYGSFEVVNLYAWRATDPEELYEVVNPIGPDNEKIVGSAIGRCDIIICAWGAHPAADGNVNRMMNELSYHRPAVFCLGRTKSGAPKHPLYLKSIVQLSTYGV